MHVPVHSIVCGVLGALSVVLAVVVAALKWAVLPGVVHNQVIQNVELLNNTSQWSRFEELPIALSFKVYLMEVDNPEDVLGGARVRLVERGPYVYRESRHKVDIRVNGSHIAYNENEVFHFDKDASGNLTEDDMVTTLNPALNAAMQIVESQFEPFLTPLNLGFQYILGSDSLFLRSKVRDLLFDGIRVCDPATIATIKQMLLRMRMNLVCNNLRTIAAGIRNMRLDNDGKTILFSLLHHKNDTNDGKYQVNSGADNVLLVGDIERWNGSPDTGFWEANSTCSRVHGRDSIVYPPFVSKQDTLNVFNTDICRTVQLRYQRDTTFRDVDVSRFALSADSLRSPKNYSPNRCYCIKLSGGIVNPEDGCYFDGIMDLYTCYGSPVVLSLPHFLWADPIYKDAVDGLQADESKHLTFVDLQRYTGTPLQGAKRVQYNMFVRKVSKMDMTQKLTDTAVPIFWVEEGVKVNDDLYDQLLDMYVNKVKIIDIVTWTLMALGVAGLLLSVILWCYFRRKRTAV